MRSRRPRTPLAVSHPALSRELADDLNDFTSWEIGSGFGHAWWRCNNEHEFQSAVANRVRGQRCPYCIGRKVLPTTSMAHHYPDLVAQWSDRNPKTPHEVWFKNTQPHWWHCDHGHEHRTSIAQRMRAGCPYCADTAFLPGVNDLHTIHPDLAMEYHQDNDRPATQIFYRSQFTVCWQCAQCDHEYRTRVAHRTIGGTQCPACVGNVIMGGLNDLTTFAPHLVPYYDAERTGRPVTTVGKGRDVWWRCDAGHSFTASPHLLLFRAPDRVCRVCHPHSQIEYDVVEVVTALLPGVDIVRNDRRVIAPYEVDILIPAVHTAIEVNGTYWHSDAVLLSAHGMTATAYHAMKAARCAHAGYRLITVWEQDWRDDPAAVVATLRDELCANC